MTHLTDDRLVDIALGSSADATETEHLTGCSECAAALDGVTDTVTLTRSLDSSVLVAPPVRVWDAIQAEIRTQSAPVSLPELHAGHAFLNEPVSSHDSLDDSAAAEAQATVTDLSRRRRDTRRPAVPGTWLLAAACVLGIVLGVGGATIADRMGTDPEPGETTVASADLAPLDSPTTQGRAVLVDRADGLDLSVSAAGLDAGEGYLEVWLINRDLTRMVSVGVLPSDATEIVLPVSQDLIDEGYVIVDISRERFDDQPAHSGDTVVRGELPV